MELSVISGSPGVAVSAVADRQDITLARVGGGRSGALSSLQCLSVSCWPTAGHGGVVTDRSLQGSI